MKLTDDLLTEALWEIDVEMLSELPKDEEIHHDFSKRFERRMRKMIRFERRTPFRRKFVSYGKRAAMFILIAVIVAVTTIMSVDALRTRFFAMISNTFPKYSEIYFKPVESEVSSKIVSKFIRYTIHYLPSGYKMTNNLSDTDLQISDFDFENSNKDKISLHQENISTSDFNINTEGVKKETVQLNDGTAYYNKNKGLYTIVWHNDKYAFLLSADATSKLDKNQMVKIAESVAPQK